MKTINCERCGQSYGINEGGNVKLEINIRDFVWLGLCPQCVKEIEQILEMEINR